MVKSKKSVTDYKLEGARMREKESKCRKKERKMMRKIKSRKEWQSLVLRLSQDRGW